MTAPSRPAKNAAEWLAWANAIQPYTGPFDAAYDGPEPTEGHVSGREADLRAEVEYGARQRYERGFAA